MNVPQAARCFKSSKVVGSGASFISAAIPGPRGIQRNQGKSQSSVMEPRTTKKGRHPYRDISVPPSNMPKAGPQASPDAMIEFADARREAGKYFASIFEYAGYATDSPMPRTSRTTSKAANPCKNPVALVAADQRKKPMAITQLTLTRSTSQP